MQNYLYSYCSHILTGSVKTHPTSISRTIVQQESDPHQDPTHSIAEHAPDSYYLSMIKEKPFSIENIPGRSACIGGLDLCWVEPTDAFNFIQDSKIEYDQKVSSYAVEFFEYSEG